MAKDAGLQEAIESSNGPVEVLRFYNDTITLYYDDALHAYYREDNGVKILVPGATTITAMIDKSGPLVQWAANCTAERVREVSPTKAVEFHSVKYISLDDLEGILEQARFAHRDIKHFARDLGKDAHGWLEAYIKAAIAGEKFDWELPEEEGARKCVTAALAWMNKHQFKPYHSEKKVYSLKYDYSGTLDWIADITSCGDHACCPFIGTCLILGDFKSSKRIYDDYRVQLAGYQMAWEEEFPDQPIGARIILRLGKDDGEFETLFVSQEEYETDCDGFLGTLSMYLWQKQIELNRKFDKADAKARAKELKEQAKKLTKVPRKAVIRGATKPRTKLTITDEAA